MSVYVEVISLVKKKSNRFGNLFRSIGRCVGVPFDKMNSLSLGLPLFIL
jgi:hypothetical protein